MELERWLFDDAHSEFIPQEIVREFYKNFKEKDPLTYSHPVNMLLTLAVFNEKFNKKAKIKSVGN